MNRSHGLAALVLTFGLGSAIHAADVERISAEDLERYGKAVAELAAKQTDPPLKLDLDASKAAGVHVDGAVAALVIPSKTSESEVQAAAGADQGAPIGLLALYKVDLVSDGKPVPADRLRSITVTSPECNEARTAALFYLAVHRISEHAWTLLVYSKDKTPVLKAPFTREDSPDAQDPLDVTITEIQDGKGALVITVMKKYQAKLHGVRQGSE